MYEYKYFFIISSKIIISLKWKFIIYSSKINYVLNNSLKCLLLADSGYYALNLTTRRFNFLATIKMFYYLKMSLTLLYFMI